MEDTRQKILLLEQSVDRVSGDISEVKHNVRQVQEDLSQWFDRLDDSVQELRLSQTKLEEQAKARDHFEELLSDQLKELKGFQSKLFLALAGGGVSLVVWLIQVVFPQ